MAATPIFRRSIFVFCLSFWAGLSLPAQTSSVSAVARPDICDILPDRTLFMFNFDRLSGPIARYLDTPQGRGNLFDGIDRLKKASEVVNIYVDKGEKSERLVEDPEQLDRLRETLMDVLPLWEAVGMAIVDVDGDFIMCCWIDCADPRKVEELFARLKGGAFLQKALQGDSWKAFISGLKGPDGFEGKIDKYYAFKQYGRLFFFLSEGDGRFFSSLRGRADFVPFSQSAALKKMEPFNQDCLFFVGDMNRIDQMPKGTRAIAKMCIDIFSWVFTVFQDQPFVFVPWRDFCGFTRGEGTGPFGRMKIVAGKSIALSVPPRPSPDAIAQLEGMLCDATITLQENSGAQVTSDGVVYDLFPHWLAGALLPNPPGDWGEMADFNVTCPADESVAKILSDAKVEKISAWARARNAFRKLTEPVCRECAPCAQWGASYVFEAPAEEAPAGMHSAVVIRFKSETQSARFVARLGGAFRSAGIAVLDSREGDSAAFRLKAEGPCVLAAECGNCFGKLQDGLRNGPSPQARARFEMAKKLASPQGLERCFSLVKKAPEQKEWQTLAYEPGKTAFNASFGLGAHTGESLYGEAQVSAGLLTEIVYNTMEVELNLEVTQEFPPDPNAPKAETSQAPQTYIP